MLFNTMTTFGHHFTVSKETTEITHIPALYSWANRIPECPFHPSWGFIFAAINTYVDYIFPIIRKTDLSIIFGRSDFDYIRFAYG